MMCKILEGSFDLWAISLEIQCRSCPAERHFPAASSASAGALEFCTRGALLHAMKPLPTVLKELRGSGFQIIRTGYDDKGVMRPLETLSLDGPMCSVAGGEHRGMRTNISRECDEHVFIGRADSAPEELDSLNVSATATVILSRLSDHGA